MQNIDHSLLADTIGQAAVVNEGCNAEMVEDQMKTRKMMFVIMSSLAGIIVCPGSFALINKHVYHMVDIPQNFWTHFFCPVTVLLSAVVLMHCFVEFFLILVKER